MEVFFARFWGLGLGSLGFWIYLAGFWGFREFRVLDLFGRVLGFRV